MAIGLPHWADSSSAEATSSDDSEPPRESSEIIYIGIPSRHRPRGTSYNGSNLRHAESEPYAEIFCASAAKSAKATAVSTATTTAAGNRTRSALSVGLFGDPDPFNMSNQQGKWREDQVLVVCPGSQTTMAQLGCSELTPPAHRIPTRMFKDEDSDEYRPFYTYKRKKTAKTEKSEKAETTAPADGANDEDEWEYIEDRDSVEDAIYPMQGTLTA